MTPSSPSRIALAPILFLAACESAPGSGLDGGASFDAVPGLDAPIPADATVDAGNPAQDGGVILPDGGQPPPCEPPPPASADEVRTTHATLRGVEGGTTRVFLGVPYASPPVAELRFRAPAPPACERTVRPADTFGPVCPQRDRDGSPIGDEDCLTLNVWAPRDPPPEPRPVLFFIHGGGNNQGSSSMLAGTGPLYDGEALASLGNVVVTINYRLGALGFATHPQLDGESGSSSGNYALRDQLAALAWVRDNVAAFGGDPSRVMIFGESAGGLDVCALYTSPLARGLFARALIQSGGCQAVAKRIGTESTQELIEAAGCASASDAAGCLRAKTPAELLDATAGEVDGLTTPAFGPIVDGDVLPVSPLAALLSGDHADVPLVLGSNAQETYPMFPGPAMVDSERERDRLARQFLIAAGAPLAKIDDIIAAYPSADYGGSPHAALVALTTDWRWTCAGRLFLRSLASTATAPLYRYYFTHALDATAAPLLSRAGAYHGLELLYVFGSIAGVEQYEATAADLALAARIQRYWSRFAASGDPNAAEDPAWPHFTAEGDEHLVLTEPTVAGAGVRTAQCDALERILQ